MLIRGPGSCRQAAHREKVRAAQAERDRADQLTAAKAATARLWRPLEEAGSRDAAANLASLARQYREAADLPRELAVP